MDTRHRARRATAFDVAQLAGVTQPTVSRALRGSPNVSNETRARVIAAAQELNYVPDANAASLRGGETNTLALVIICRPGEAPTHVNPFYFSLMGSVAASASLAGYKVLVSFQDSQGNFSGGYDDARQADGMIVIGTTQNMAAWEYFRSIDYDGKAWACWGSPFDELGWVRSDNAEGGRIATDHLVAGGRRKIVFIGSRTSLQRQFDERYQGYEAAMIAHGLSPVLVEVDEAMNREEQGAVAVRQMVASGMEFDGIFAACDLMALGVLRSLEDAGIAVPSQVGVVGFDGIRAGSYTTPALTSVEPDYAVAGDLLVKAVLARLRGTDLPDRRVPVQLLVRNSCTA
jgi:DNA-binding LacI/PurR family transcriptional regulator